MTRINTIQEIQQDLPNVSELTVGLLHRVKPKSTVLLVVSWQTTGSPNSVSFTGCDQYLSILNPVRSSLKYVQLAGGGVPVYAGPNGNTIGMAALAVKASDMRAYQGRSHPSNIIVKLSGTVTRLSVYAIEVANLPAFKYRDVQVQMFNNLSAGTINLSTSTRPFSFDLVGVAFASPNKRTIVHPWGGGDARFLGPHGYAQAMASNAPFSMKQGFAMMGMLGGIADVAGQSRTGFDAGGTASMPFPFDTQAAMTFWHAIGMDDPGSIRSAMRFADFANSSLLEGLREETYVEFSMAVWGGQAGLGGASSFGAQISFIINPVYTANPALLTTLDGESPQIIIATQNAALVQTDVLIGWNMYGSVVRTAAQIASRPDLGILAEINAMDLASVGESEPPSFLNGSIATLYQILQNLAPPIENVIEAGEDTMLGLG